MLKDLDLSEINKLKTKEIKDLADRIPEEEYMDFIEIFSADERKSVQSICEKLKKALARKQAEEERLDLLNYYENECYKNGAIFVAGLDEVGRGLGRTGSGSSSCLKTKCQDRGHKRLQKVVRGKERCLIRYYNK